MVSVGRLVAAGAAALLLPEAAFAAIAPACEDIVTTNRAAEAPRRPLVAEDLVRLRDVGPLDPDQQDGRLLTLSPDESRVAFQLRRADPRSNLYCIAIVVMDLRSGAEPRVIDLGNEPIRATIDFRGRAALQTGIPLVLTPRWSPDGRWVAFLKRVDGINQVWRAFVDGSGSEPLTRSAVDVEDFRIGADGTTILFVSRPGLLDARAAIAREEAVGFHYDDRYAAAASSRPFPPAPIARARFAQIPGTAETRPATIDEARLLTARDDRREEVWTVSRSQSGKRAWLDASGGPSASGVLMAETGEGRALACGHPDCSGAYRPFWSSDGSRVRYFRREGWANASTAIYEWVPGTAQPRRIYATGDVFADCGVREDSLICFRDGSRQPRRLERLDLADGGRELIFDPNPEFSRLQLGRVERLHLRNAMGYESVADLVLPVGFRRGRSYPLVVVQYQTRGFLRGGTGDEYPIQAFANRGYAVLSIGRPPSVGLGAATPTEIGRIDLAGFADRRSTLSTVETGVRLLLDRGIADPARIGITGMSDGATTVTFALLHSNLFSTAAMSQCCFDTSLPTRVGPVAARHFFQEGYPRLTDDGTAFWSQISLSRNARRVRTPILLQLADTEYMSALESFTALREVGAPIDMFVFPGEQHVKWQPAHRLAVYERSVDWFDYWLRGIRSSAPERQAELTHWDSLRGEPQPIPAAGRR
jgi:dipeptidyl aminopeptidase/acylaminoacyl peptidase